MKLVLFFLFFCSFLNANIFLTESFWYKTNVTALKDALKKDKLDVFAKDKKGYTPLMLAAESSQESKIIKLLLRKGAKLEEKNEYGWTPLMLAAGYNPEPKISKILISTGADINAKSKNGWTPLMLAILYNKNSKVIYTFLKHPKINLNIVNKQNQSAFFLAAFRNKNPQMLRDMIEAGANVNIRDKSGENVLFASLKKGNVENLKVLLEATGDLNNRNENGDTALMIASKFTKDTKIIDLLLKSKIDINSRNKKGKTALILASQYNKNPQIIEFLLKSGASPQITDKKGFKALDYMKKNPDLYETKAYWNLNDKTYR